jgi:hypothetical protein
VTDPTALADIGLYKDWLANEHGISDWDRYRERDFEERSELWIAFQQQRWGFNHFIGDDCPPDGHLDEMFDYLEGRVSRRTYGTLFST